MMNLTTLKKANKGQRALLLIVAAMLACALFIMTAKPANADSYKIDGKFVTNSESDFSGVASLPDDMQTKFKLYKVGTFSGERDENGRALLALYDAYKNVKVDDVIVNLNNFETDEVGKWLSVANAIADIAATKTEDKTTSSDANGNFTFTDCENGLYLITGESKKIEDYPNPGKASYFWPQPMLVLVWNGSVEINLKPQIESVNKLRITKAWEGDKDVADLVRPAEITVKISYDKELWKEVTLNNDNNWTFEWETPKGMENPKLWSCEEVFEGDISKNYKTAGIDEKFLVGTDDAGNAETTYAKTITNTYDRKYLDIEKTVGSFASSGTEAATFVFQLIGKDKDESEVYNKYVGMNYDPAKPETHKLSVNDIPTGLDTLQVTEVYSSNYTPDQKTKTAILIEASDEVKEHYEVSFENNNPEQKFGTGIINKGKINDGKTGYEADGKIENQ